MNGMRKIGMIAAVALLTALVIGACGGKNISKGDVPDWYLNPPSDKDKIFGTGASQPMQSVEFAKKVADDNARQAIAATMQTTIQSMLRQFMQQSGTMEQARALQFAETVSKNVVNTTLTGVVITKREIKNGSCYSLAEVSKDSINGALLNAARNAAAEYSELKAKEAFDALEKEINKKNY